MFSNQGTAGSLPWSIGVRYGVPEYSRSTGVQSEYRSTIGVPEYIRNNRKRSANKMIYALQ